VKEAMVLVRPTPPGAERRPDGLLYPLNFDHVVSFGSYDSANGDYLKDSLVYHNGAGDPSGNNRTRWLQGVTPPTFILNQLAMWKLTASQVTAWTGNINTIPTWDSSPVGFRVNLGIDKSTSWVRNWVDDPQKAAEGIFTTDQVEQTREHEQIHFDLAALAVADFLNQIPRWDSGTFQSHVNNWQTLKKYYESDTNFGSNQAQQNLWRDRINGEKTGQIELNTRSFLKTLADMFGVPGVGVFVPSIANERPNWRT
jgi:hypothetical protein